MTNTLHYTDKIYIYDSCGRLQSESAYAERLLEAYFAQVKYEVVFLQPHASFCQDPEDHTNCGVYVLVMAWFLCLPVSVCDPQVFVERFDHIVLTTSVQVSFNTPSFSSPSIGLSREIIGIAGEKGCQFTASCEMGKPANINYWWLCCAQEPLAVDSSSDEESGSDDEMVDVDTPEVRTTPITMLNFDSVVFRVLGKKREKYRGNPKFVLCSSSILVKKKKKAKKASTSKVLRLYLLYCLAEA